MKLDAFSPNLYARLGTRWRGIFCIGVALWLAALYANSQHGQDEGQRKVDDPVVEFQRTLQQAQTLFAAEQEKYFAARNDLIRADAEARFLNVTVTEEEQTARQYFAKLQAQEIDGFRRRGEFPPAEPFFVAKEAIEASPIYGLIQKLPKGGVLHIHSSSCGSARWLIDVAGQRPDCYVYWPLDGIEQNGQQLGQLAFYKPGTEPDGFRPCGEVRASVPDFETRALQLLTFGPEDIGEGDPWKKFNTCFGQVGGPLSIEPVFVGYITNAFETLIADGVDYVELRSGIGRLYDFDNHTWPGEQFIQKFLEIRDDIHQKHPDFDFKLIISDWRGAQEQDIWAGVNTAVALRAKYPDFIAGYDLVGEEDTGKSTESFLDVWLGLPMICAKYKTDLPLYFHAGETDWADDENLYDAYLLGARRIGHGLNLSLSPALERRFIEQGIPLEICPISNQILGYVRDLRTHPARDYIRRGVPCVISSDDPGVFGYDGLSYDYWEAFMAWELDLLDLKQFALNSIQYSAMSTQEKEAATARWEKKWHGFIQLVNEQRMADEARQLVK